MLPFSFVRLNVSFLSDILQEPIERFGRTRLILQVGSALFACVILLQF